MRPIAATRCAELRSLEGCRVGVALLDGSRIDDSQLVSAPRHGANSVWLFTGLGDVFVPVEDIADLWEA